MSPREEPDGSYSPSPLALRLATSAFSGYTAVGYEAYRGARSKVLVLFTEQKDMTMRNGRRFSTGNHPVEALVPMLHLRNAGFEFEIVTITGKPVVLEMWAMPTKDRAVLTIYEDLKPRFESPKSLNEIIDSLPEQEGSIAAIFIPGGHGSMLGIPEDANVGSLLRWVHSQGLLTISICHGPGALLATALDGHDFLYSGYKMAVFPDAVDKQTPMIGYMPGHLPWELGAKLTSCGAIIVNKKGDDTTYIDRNLITGASPKASDKLGKLAAQTLLERLGS